MTDPTAQRFAHVSFAALSDVGLRRENNEDAHGEWPAQGVFCVADGMGGAEDGEIASRTIVETLSSVLARWSAYAPPIGQPDRLSLLDRAIAAASAIVRDYADTHGKAGCGSTFVGVSLDPGDPSRAVALHAGDSRLYRVRGHRISQVTRDHSIATLVGAGSEQEVSPALRSLVLRAVGVNEAVELERTPFDIAERDWLLLCSDGLFRMVTDRDITRILSASPSPEEAASALVAAANGQGGVDNVTVVLLRVGPLPPASLPVHARLSPGESDSLFDGIPFAAPASEEETQALPPPDPPPPPAVAPRPSASRAGVRRFLRHHRVVLLSLAFLVLAALAAFAGFFLARRHAGPASSPVRSAEPPPSLIP